MIPQIKPGGQITADLLNRLRKAVLSMIKPGRGITVSYAGDQVIIGSDAGPRGIGGGGLSIRACTTFPAIPATYTLISIEGQIWAAGPDDTAWYPLYQFTDTEGEPETTP